jgi:NTE family protein
LAPVEIAAEVRAGGLDAFVVARPSDARQRLRTLAILAAVDDELLDEIEAAVDWLRVPAGTCVFRVGDPPDGMYGLVTGRIRFFAEEDGRSVLTAEANAGITFGEGSLLIGGGRSRTAVVVRDAELARLPPERFRDLMSTSSALAMSIAGSVAARFAVPTDVPALSLSSIAIDAPSGQRDVRWCVERLRSSLGSDVVLVDHREAGTLHAARQSDLLVVVRSGGPPHDLQVLRDWHSGLDPLAAPPAVLVLVHDRVTSPPIATAEWYRAFRFGGHLHVRVGATEDVRRFARYVRGEAVALVLGGGGARGLGHIGVLKAMSELAIPVDRTGGSSMGAIIGGQAAMGWTWEEILEANRRAWTRLSLRLDLTLPTVSVSSGRRLRRALDEMFGDVEIEDLWLPFFCTTVNLSRFRLAIHRRGRAATWIRASASAPGLWPPVVDAEGELHIDGGQLNNVPTDIMGHGHRGRIIAVDVCAAQAPMRVEGGAEPPVGLRHLLSRRARPRYPSLVDTVNRCALLGSLQHRELAAEHADVYLTPDLSTIGFAGFSRLEEAVEIGYRAAMGQLGAGAGQALQDAGSEDLRSSEGFGRGFPARNPPIPETLGPAPSPTTPQS